MINKNETVRVTKVSYYDREKVNIGDVGVVACIVTERVADSWSGRDIDETRYIVYFPDKDESIKLACDTYLEPYYEDEYEEYEEEINNENNNTNNMEVVNMMNTNNMMSMMCGMDFGTVERDDIRMSMNGSLAIRNKEGQFVVYDMENNSLTDMTPMTFEIKGMLFKMSVKVEDIKSGDIILNNNKPVIVLKIKENELSVLNPYNNTKSKIVLVKNMFGFVFVTKIVNMMEMMNGNINPMMFMMNGNNNESMQNMMLMSMVSNGNINPMMLMMMNNMNK